MLWNYVKHFEHSAKAYASRPAVCAGDAVLSYADLRDRVTKLAGHLTSMNGGGRVGVLATRSIETCVAFLGCGWAGKTYVPLGLNLPEERLVAMLRRLDLDALVVDRAGMTKLSAAVIEAAPELLLAPQDGSGWFEAHPASRARSCACEMERPADIAPDHLAYIIFTSGTTGMPKGVMVNGRSITLYQEAIHPHYALTPEDRAAETCESNFDLSIHNMLTCWRGGACLYIMRPLDLVAPARFIRANRITTWLSVPSVITLMRKAGGLRPGSLDSLRMSWFCGEPLPVEAARAWAEAAPNAAIVNFYGPTEITIAVVVQPFDGEGPVTPERGIVAIGRAIAGITTRIVDPDGREMPDGAPGEIVLSGQQCASGYFREPELTAKVFRMIDDEPAYFTGDRGYRDAEGVLHHLGRFDNQIKFKGHRIELEEIDAQLRAATGSSVTGTVTWPRDGDVVEGLAGFYSVPGLDMETVRQRLRAKLPPHMVPAIIENLADMPLSPNGKVDRKALVAMLDEREAFAVAAQ